MSSSLLILLWVASLGADRLDLLGGRGPILLLPFQVLTALVVFTEWRRRLRGGRWPAISAEAWTFIALVLGLLALMALSVLRSADVAVSLGRAALLGATAVGVPLAVWGMADRSDMLAILARGARWGLVVAVVFNALALLSLLGAAPGEFVFGAASVNAEPSMYGVIPRLSGAASDMNRGGLMALLHAVLVALDRPAKRGQLAWVLLGLFLALGSLSRSVYLAAAPVVLLLPRFMEQRSRAAWPRAAAVVLAAVAVFAAVLLQPNIRESVAESAAPLAARFSLQEGSSQAHAFLFSRAVSVATSDVTTTLLGIGVGTSFRVLADFFAGNPYGNFHSTWLTLWVESGIFAALVALALVLLPLRRAGPLRGVLLGLALYNGFYNGLGEPLFWVMLALAWLAPQLLVPPRDASQQLAAQAPTTAGAPSV
ncbi:MAG: O-antigen ligase family protein [Gemmatimonadaceae bacterium]|nr:O-antigen ligase family protein [Gemmatimonadaceae bacterium]